VTLLLFSIEPNKKDFEMAAPRNLAEQLYDAKLDYSSVTSEYLQALCKKIIALTEDTYNQLGKLLENPAVINFSLLMQPLIDLEILTSRTSKFCTFLLLVHPEKNIRLTSEEINGKLNQIKVACEQREDVSKVFQHYFKHAFKTEKDQLSAEQLRYCQTVEKNYLRNGLLITDTEKKNRITVIKNQLSELSKQFQSNIRNLNTSIIFTKEELNGVPDFWFTQEKEIGEEKFKCTLKYPDYFPIIEYAKNRETRKKLYIAYQTRCVDENLPLLNKMILLRDELAKLLGYENYADYMAETRMTRKAKTIKDFLDKLILATQKDYITMVEKVSQLAQHMEQDASFVLQNYDIAYYNRLYIEKELQLDLKEFNSYFNVDRVLKQTFHIYEELLSLKIIETKNPNKWHAEVRTFEVYDRAEKEKKLGTFYLDLFPREGKYNHFAAFDLIPTADISHLEKIPHTRQLASVAMVCNFSREGTMAFDPEVITFFHEFGHVMHYLCAKNSLAKFHPYAAETDFIEAPSQMLENWCYDYRILKMISAHPQTGEPLPESIAEKLTKFRILNNIFENRRQLCLSRFDYDIHSQPAEILANADLKSHYQHILQTLRHPITPVAEECYPGAFLHVSGGMDSINYAAGYYGYLLSMTYAADMFNCKFKANPLDKNRGMIYRKTILEKGATEDGFAMICDFLGREPSLDAFKQNYGFASAEKSHTSNLLKFSFHQPPQDAKVELSNSQEHARSVLGAGVSVGPGMPALKRY
jgi:thimet oligopeptidase